jgi:hypothetical protein
LFICFPTPTLDQSRNNLPSPIPCLPLHKIEDLIIHASKSFFGDDSDYDTSLPMIASLVMSAPSLKHLTLVVRFWSCGIFSLRDFDWSPLNLFCSSSLECIKLHVTEEVGFNNVPFEELLPSLEGNADLMRMVNQGLLTIKTDKFDLMSL